MTLAKENKSCIVIAGPTAVGKTGIAIEIAKELSTCIISADSRQCFTELDIGVAKPSTEQLSHVQHFFINSHTIHEDLNAATFENYALVKATAQFEEKDVLIMTGGTGLYIKAFCEGLDTVPQTDPEIRKNLTESYNSFGLAWLMSEIQRQDPEFVIKSEGNPQRMLRALEVKLSSGRSILNFQTGVKKERPFSIKKIGLELPRTSLNTRIDNRVNLMMEKGLLDEVKSLYNYKHLNALQAVGYRELFDYLDGVYSLDEAVNRIKINTRQYAKRQMTWFKKDPEIAWQHADSFTF